MQTISEHIKELRLRTIYVVSVFFISLSVGVMISERAIEYIRTFIDFQKYNIELITASPIDSMMMYLNFAMTFAFVLTVPAIIYHSFRFIEPALTEKEKGISNKFIVASATLYIIGMIFGASLLKTSLLAMAYFSLNSGIMTLWTMNDAISFFVMTPLFLGAMFQLPLLLSILDKTKLLSFERLKSKRGMMIVAILLIGGILSPSGDVISQIIYSIPMYALFEATPIISLLW